MIIKELNLIGFGQFNNKLVELKDGLNIIYGENEAGKTTIHNFINGMFYGFLKPYARRTIYLDEHGKYNPWDSSRYGGIIRFTYDGKEYRIERDFTKNQESTNVILEDTGEDITNTIDNGEGGRILQPGYHFFGFNNAVFSNTLSIKQLGNKTEDSLANEVRERLVNVSTTLDDTLSVEKATDQLSKSIKDIGTIRATTSPYGIKYEKLNQLKTQRESILESKNEYDSLLLKKEIYDKELDSNIKELKKQEDRLVNAEILNKNKLYLEAKNIKDAILDLELKSESYKKYKDLSIEDYSIAMDLNSTVKNIDEKIKEYKDTLAGIENTIEQLETIKIEENQYLKDIDLDFSKYEELEDEMDGHRYTDYNNKIQFLERDRSDNIATVKKLNFISIIGVALIIISIAAPNISPYLVMVTSLVSLFMVIYAMRSLKNLKGQLGKIDSQIEEVEDKERLRLEKIKAIDTSLSGILVKYETSSKLELKRIYDKSQYNIINKEQISNSMKENRIKQDDLNQRIKTLKEDNLKNRVKLDKIIKGNSSNDLEEFKSALANKKIYEDTVTEISSKTQLFHRILGEYDFDKLKDEMDKYDKDLLSISETMTIDELKTNINHKNQEISNLKIEISRFEEQIKHLNKEISKLVEIDEEINRISDFLRESDEKIEALELAKSTIENISKDIHRQFAPMINRKVGNIIEDITGGKYSGVKIDNSLEIGVVNPDTQEILDINSLSGGTIDQLYFALRFGIVDSINNGGLPLILDDCFIQYDDNRLRNIMKFLYDKSKERQIILFTCHKRENKILDEMEGKYNLINLNEVTKS